MISQQQQQQQNPTFKTQSQTDFSGMKSTNSRNLSQHKKYDTDLLLFATSRQTTQQQTDETQTDYAHHIGHTHAHTDRCCWCSTHENTPKIDYDQEKEKPAYSTLLLLENGSKMEKSQTKNSSNMP